MAKGKKKKGKASAGDARKMITYFAKPGAKNTKKVIDLAFGRAKKLGIRTILVPSTSGKRTTTIAAR